MKRSRICKSSGPWLAGRRSIRRKGRREQAGLQKLMKARKVPVPKRARQVEISRTPEIFICLLLGIAILAVYSQTFGYGFVSFDDGTYVYRNEMIKEGLSGRALGWAFTTFYAFQLASTDMDFLHAGRRDVRDQSG